LLQRTEQFFDEMLAMRCALAIHLKTLTLLILVSVLHGCGGGGSSSSSNSHSGGSGGSTVQGVATPSSVSVVTAQNAGS
jgi:uncharacterized spore protein YtfJ